MFTPSNFLRDLVAYVPRLLSVWEAKECVLEMREAGYRHWRQTEWVGFYLEFLIENVSIPGVALLHLVVGNTLFDGCAGKAVIDYKTSSLDATGIILNDKAATDRVLLAYGELGYMVVRGASETETDDELELWRRRVAGTSSYVASNATAGRSHRKLKTRFAPSSLLYVSIRQHNLGLLHLFNQGRNSDGHPRNVKYLLPISLLDKFVAATLDLKSLPGPPHQIGEMRRDTDDPG